MKHQLFPHTRPLIRLWGYIRPFFWIGAIIFITLSTWVSVNSRVRAAEDFTIALPIIVRDHPLPGTIFGIEARKLDSENGFDEILAADADWTRRNSLTWYGVEPTEGQRNWPIGLEQELIDAHAEGVKVILIVKGTPDWAQLYPGVVCGRIRPDKLTAFSNFLFDAVSRYSKPPYNVKYWELWNEPDVDPDKVNDASQYGCWGEPDAPYYGGGFYADMLKAAYPKIKAANPQALVLIGGLLMECDPRNVPPWFTDCNPSNYFEGILANGGGPFFDGVSFHAYDFYGGNGVGRYANLNWWSAYNSTGPVVLAKTHFLKNLMATYGVSNKVLMNTESGLLCDTCDNDNDFELTKAYYVAQVYPMALDEGLQSNMWFRILGWRNSNLIKSDFTPLPAYYAYQFARSFLGSATSLGPIGAGDVSNPSGIAGYKLMSGDRQIWVIWSLDGNPHTVSLALGAPDAVYDVFGTSLPATATMTVDIAPRYLEWAP